MPSIAIATCAQLPELDADESLLLPPLHARGIAATPAVWDDPDVDWDSFDATVIRSPWDYQDRRGEFVSWAHRVPRLYNPAPVVEWNTDKRYLGDLAAAGVPVVPTTWMPPSAPVALPARGDWVLKPAIGAGSRDAGLYRFDDADEAAAARDHVARLHAVGSTVMAQPYIDSVDVTGETALIFMDGRFSHAVRKSAMLQGPYSGEVGLYKEEKISAVEPSPMERELAERTLTAIPAPGPMLYARVDILNGADGLLVLEVELTEPSLFFQHAPDSADRLADAIARRLLPGSVPTTGDWAAPPLNGGVRF